MAHRSLVTLAAALALAALAGPARAQATPKPAAAKQPEAPKADKPAERRPGATLRVQLVISRFDGEKKVASLPYTLTVMAGGHSARMRLGVDTPIPITQIASADGGKPTASYQYRNVGTNLDCSARDLGDGRYQLQVSVENSSTVGGTDQTREGMPLFRRFDTSLDPVLRDGQSMQVIASTDPVSGEVMKIDVTLSVVK
jgi:Flp pilus assembly secretin CpaC